MSVKVFFGRRIDFRRGVCWCLSFRSVFWSRYLEPDEQMYTSGERGGLWEVGRGGNKVAINDLKFEGHAYFTDCMPTGNFCLDGEDLATGCKYLVVYPCV